MTVVEPSFCKLNCLHPYDLVKAIEESCYGCGKMPDFYLDSENKFLVNRNAHASFFVVSDVGLHKYLEDLPDVLISNVRPYQYLVTISLASIQIYKSNNDLVFEFDNLINKIFDNNSESAESTITLSGLKSTIVYLPDVVDITKICDLSDKYVSSLINKHRYISVYSRCPRCVSYALSQVLDCVTVESPEFFNYQHGDEFTSIDFYVADQHIKKQKHHSEINTRITDYLEYCEDSYHNRYDLFVDNKDNYNLLPSCVCLSTVFTGNMLNWLQLNNLISTFDSVTQKFVDNVIKTL